MTTTPEGCPPGQARKRLGHGLAAPKRGGFELGAQPVPLSVAQGNGVSQSRPFRSSQKAGCPAVRGGPRGGFTPRWRASARKAKENLDRRRPACETGALFDRKAA
jgi:hypothetical protein